MPEADYKLLQDIAAKMGHLKGEHGEGGGSSLQTNIATAVFNAEGVYVLHYSSLTISLLDNPVARALSQLSDDDLANQDLVVEAIAQLGSRFGETHGDPKDFVGGYTFVHPIGVDDDQLIPYLFRIHDLGINFKPKFNSVVVFNGLFFHSGTQPMYKEKPARGAAPAYRIVLVHYATQGAFEFGTREQLIGEHISEPESREFEYVLLSCYATNMLTL